MISYLNIRKNEYKPTLYGFLYSFLIVSFFILSKSYRDSLFLNNFTKQDLSYLYLITPILTGLLVWLSLLILKKINLPLKSLVIHLVVCFLAISLLLSSNLNSILIYYIFVEFQISIIAILFWDVLSESFTNRQAKRLFVIITSGGFLSALIVGGSMPYISKLIPQNNFVIAFNFLILFCPYLVYLLIKSSFKEDVSISKNKTRIGLKNIFKSKYILNIILITFVFSILSVIIDYNFKIFSFNKFQDNPLELTNYFAKFYSITSFISFVIQLTISGFIINRFGIKYALMVLPMLLFIFFILGYFITPFIIVLLLKSKEQIFKSTLHDTSMHILWMPIPSFKRITIKPFINILLKNIFSSLSAGLLIISVYFNYNFVDFIPIAVVLLSVLIFLTRRTKDLYVQELIKAIDDRTLSLDDSVSYIADDNEMLNIIKNKLIEEKNNRYFILSLLDKTIIEKCKETLGEVFFDSDSITQKLILKYMVDDEDKISSHFLKNQIDENSDISIECLDVMCRRNIKDIELINENLFNDENQKLKFSAIDNSIKYDYKSKDNARELIKSELIKKKNLSYLINCISSDSYGFTKSEIINLTSDISYDEFIKSLKFITLKNCDREVLEIIFDRLPDGYYLNSNVKKMFKIISSENLYNFLEYKFLDRSVDNKTKKLIINVIRFLNDELYVKIYLKYINLSNFDYEIMEQVFDNLIYFKETNEDYVINNKISDSLIENLIFSQFFDINIIYLLNQSNKEEKLISEFYCNKINDNSRLLKKIVYFFNDDLLKRKLQLSIFEKKIYESKVIEIFEEYLNNDLKDKIIPIIDNITLKEKRNKSLKFYAELDKVNLDILFTEKILKQDSWYYLIALYESKALENNDVNFGELIDNRYFKLFLNNLNLNERDILNKSHIESLYKHMITNLEKTLYLKDSSIFQGIPAKELIHIANNLKEVNLSSDKFLFKDGDIGDSMYFIIKGNIKILKGDLELVTLKKGDYFGEMALLDGEARSADAVSVNDSILLKLDASDFDKIMYSNDKIVKGILSMLSQRLRKANNLLNNSK